ncbi:MAG: solute carrier family 26 protein [Nocardioides sp.]|nr:solute carrier family 26 protein [Nocardioides sp.]
MTEQSDRAGTQRKQPAPSSLNRLSRWLPSLRWVRTYDRSTARADVLAGITVAVMLVPQGMAYAALAGMPPVTGLYASIFPLLVYALLGTSRTLAVGPVAIVALLTNTALLPLADGDPNRYLVLGAALAGLVGLIQLILGLARLGTLVNLLSHSVLSGFTSAAAIVIGTSQVKNLLGLEMERTEGFTHTVTALIGALPTIHWPTVAVGVLGLVLLVLAKKRAPRLPAALIVVALVTAASAVFGFGEMGIAILKEVPAGLPTPGIPAVGVQDLISLLPSALTIAVIGYVEGVSIAKALAARDRETVDPNAELVAVGAANIAAGLFRAFPVAGGFSRTAVNHQAGARTPAASIVTALIVGLAVLLFTPLFFHLPNAVLAAIIIVAVAGLVDLRTPVQTWRTRRADGLAVAVTFAGTLLLGIEAGIALGVALSIANFVWESSRPHMAELGRVRGTPVYRNVERYETEGDPSVLLLRVDAPLFFANAQNVSDRVLALVAQRPAVRFVVLDASAVTDVDADGAHTLHELDRRLADSDIALHLTTVRGPVRDLLVRSGDWSALSERSHADIPAAVQAIGLDGDSPLLIKSPHPPQMTPEVF